MSTTHPTDFNKHLGAAVRKARTTAGMSQEALGLALGVTFQQVQKYERGVNRISVETLVRIAEALNTTSGALIEAAFTEGAALVENPPSRIHLETMHHFSRLSPKWQKSALSIIKNLAGEHAA